MRFLTTLLISALLLGSNSLAIAQSDDDSGSSAPAQSAPATETPAEEPQQAEKAQEPAATKEKKDDAEKQKKKPSKTKRWLRGKKTTNKENK